MGISRNVMDVGFHSTVWFNGFLFISSVQEFVYVFFHY